MDANLYNSRVIITFLEYLKQKRPDVDIEGILRDSGISSYELEDEGHWLTQKQVDGFHDALMERTHDAAIFREAGRFMSSSKSAKAIRQFILAFLSPIQAYFMLGKIASYLNRGTTFHIKKIRRNAVEIITSQNEGVCEKPYQCENRMGSLEAVAEIFTGKLPVLEHTACLHRGDTQCRYVVSWQEPRYMKWWRGRNYLLFISILAIAICTFLFPSVKLAAMISLPAIAVIVGIAFYSQYLEKKDIYERIERQGDAANRLLDQITISYNNALLVQEIGQAVSNILDVDSLLKYVMETLQKRLNFDRGMIMLASPDRKRLVYVSGYGYSPEIETVLQETQFHLDKPDSRGPFVVAFRQQKPIFVNDIDDIKEEISVRSRDFVKALAVNSFICVPIIYEGKSEGVLAVDNYRSRRPHSQSEVNLLMGIAPQIAISINNAKSLRKIAESEERFRNLSENSPDIIYTTDNSGVITYLNPVAQEILGYSTEEMIGRHFSQFTKAGDGEAFMGLFNRVKQGTETIKDTEAKLLAKDGTERLFYMSGAPNFNAMGEIMGVVGILKDFTEQRKLEQQLHHASRMNAIGRLTGGIAHDFNNILQAINAYNERLAMNKGNDDPDLRYLMTIKELIKRATDLVSQLLIFSRKADSKLEPIDVNAEIRKFYELLISTLPKTIELELDLEEPLYIINGDAAQLGQVIMNLTVNAKDAMPRGGKIRIETRNVEFATTQHRSSAKIDAGRYALFTITDTGCGIARENLDHIFEPFFTTKEAGKGTGIGLSVVYGIIKNHNGFIFCDSELGFGTTYEIYFPATNLEILERKQEPVKKTVLSQGQETILLVDDEPALLDIGNELLSLLGYSVLTANSGENALRVIEREKAKISLVILDLMMPGMGGEKCLAEIMKIDPAMKVIVASGFAASTSQQDILRAGTVDFIQKPYQIDFLSKRIRAVLDQETPSP
ncbi:MAG: Blue-light-activated protein [Syntrophus sp. PtaU1.Bin208]|nr:MAG: Blue-light-activated protein [Syntrophus sp. PtaU1.Bin208]